MFVCLPVTCGLHRHSPVSWWQLETPSADVLMMPMSLQLQRVQPLGFEAVSPYQPGKQSAHCRPVTAALHWHWPPTWIWTTERENKRRRSFQLTWRHLNHQIWNVNLLFVLICTWAHSMLLLTVPAVLQLQGWHESTEVGSDPSSLKNPLIHSSQFLPERQTWCEKESKKVNGTGRNLICFPPNDHCHHL